VTPTTPQELAGSLRAAAEKKQTIGLRGASTKRRMAAAGREPAIAISTTSLNQILQYEPKDLTISVQAGLRWADLRALLAANRQMIPLDPPYAQQATVGGVVAANTSGPRRRWFGTARDLVIGMTFIPIDGLAVQTGGMVVKNVAGLDMGKLLIGSMGTLAAIASVNFKLAPLPEATRTFVFSDRNPEPVFARRDEILKSVLQPSSLDLVNPAAAAKIGIDGWSLLVRAGGSQRVLDRYSRELPAAQVCEGPAESKLWESIEEFTPSYLAEFPAARVVRVSSTLREVRAVAGTLPGPVVSRAGNGVTYGYLPPETRWSPPAEWQACYEYGGGDDAWLNSGDDLPLMRRVKQMLDPDGLLNPGRYYGRF